MCSFENEWENEVKQSSGLKITCNLKACCQLTFATPMHSPNLKKVPAPER